MAILSPFKGDAFEPFRVLQSSVRFWQAVSLLLLIDQSIAWKWGAWNASRPPTVIVKDRVRGEAAIVSKTSTLPPVTVADARVFFLQMVKLRFGWDSLTVMRDMGEFRKHCYKDQWAVEEKHFAELVPSSQDPRQSISRMQWWVQQGVRNTLGLPETLEDITCKEHDETFHCSMQATLITQSLMPRADEDPMVQRVIFVGTLLRVHHTMDTPYALTVGALREFPGDVLKDRNG